MQTDNSIRRGLLPALFIIPLVFFGLGFVSILSSLSAFACMSLPFILLAKNREKTWCRSYCPRASLLQLTGRKGNRMRKVPRQFTNGNLRNIMLWYFGLNLLFITGSTVRIALGLMESMAFVRLFIFIPLFPLPQLLDIAAPPFLIHLSYRLYSMMLSSTILGVVFALVWRNRLWCAVCPVGNLSNKMLGTNR